MDTNLGPNPLTSKQISNFASLKTAVILGFAYWHDSTDVVVVTTRELTAQEIIDLKAAITALPDTYSVAYNEGSFSTDTFCSRLNEILGTLSNFDLRLEVGAIERFCNNKDFAGLKAYLDLLVTNTVATAADYTAVNKLAKEQNIDLDDYAA